jgi:hypothetical protein
VEADAVKVSVTPSLRTIEKTITPVDIFPGVSRPLVIVIVIVAMAVALLGAPLAPAAMQASGPTPRQIRAAVAKAQRSSDLWATVNVCNPRRQRDVIGIRTQQPALVFSTTMSVRIQVEYWKGTAFHPDSASGAVKLLKLGSGSRGLRQTGWNFQFGPHAGRLRGLVRFQWVRAGKVIGSATRTTTGGHKNVGAADPAGYSAATCTIR